jgi:RNA polymerase sigma-70 factor (ECF subfamily)
VTEEGPLSLVFLAAAGARAAALRGSATLEFRLGELLASARRAWPELALPADSFVRHAALCVAAASDVAAALAMLHGDDLYLACACAERVPGAEAALEQRFFPALTRAAARVDPSPEFADEARQELRGRLLMPRENGRLGVASYAATGSLAAWLRISMQRIALNLHRSRRAAGLDPFEEELLGAAPEPELELLKQRFRPAFDRALVEALAVLPGRERLLLRMHYVDGLSTRRIALLMGLNQSSIARAMQASRTRLRDETLRRLGQQLELSVSQLESIAGLVISRLELSLGGALAV